MVIVNAASKGQLIPDAWDIEHTDSSVVGESWYAYAARGQRHMYAWVVFCIGAIFWICVGVAIYALVDLML